MCVWLDVSRRRRKGCSRSGHSFPSWRVEVPRLYEWCRAIGCRVMACKEEDEMAAEVEERRDLALCV